MQTDPAREDAFSGYGEHINDGGKGGMSIEDLLDIAIEEKYSNRLVEVSEVDFKRLWKFAKKENRLQTQNFGYVLCSDGKIARY